MLLACWGVLLVTRGRVRRALALLATLAALGYAATVVTGLVTLPDSVADAVREVGTGDPSAVGLTAWFWAAAVSAVLSVVATALAVAWVPAWPEMGQPVRRARDRAGWRPGRPAGGAEPPRPVEVHGRGPRPHRVTGSLHWAAAHRPAPTAAPRSTDMSDNHGNTPAAWTGVTVALLGFLVGGIGLMLDPVSMTLFWVGGRARRGCPRRVRRDGQDGPERR